MVLVASLFVVVVLLLLRLLYFHLSLLLPPAARCTGTAEATDRAAIGAPVLLDVLAKVVIVCDGVPKVSIDTTPAIAVALD